MVGISKSEETCPLRLSNRESEFVRWLKTRLVPDDDDDEEPFGLLEAGFVVPVLVLELFGLTDTVFLGVVGADRIIGDTESLENPVLARTSCRLRIF